MKNISIVTAIFNEESRIENFIKCFSWSNDLIIIDKSSTDNTQNIIKKYISETIHLITVPYTDSALIFNQVIDRVKNEWLMPITASDLIDPLLVDKIDEVISSKNFDFGEIWLPYKMYTFGICDIHSPWYAEYKPVVYKKDKFVLSDRVHEERSSSGKKYTISEKEYGYFYHITHSTLSLFYERHIRYADLETIKYDNPKAARKNTLRHILSAIKYIFFTKKTYKLGWDGIALSFAYISYWIMVYLSVWQKYNKKGEELYFQATNDVLNKWNKKK